MSKAFVRSSRSVRQMDVIEWFRLQKAPLAIMRKDRYKEEKGFIAYGKDIAAFFRSRGTEKNAKPNENDQRAARAMDQHNQSQELLQRMKWKRATWEHGADYEAFSQRLLENDKMFGKCPAFSFMSIHVAKDPATAAAVEVTASAAATGRKTQLEPGALTKWFTEERQPTAMDVYRCRPSSARRPPYTVDWVSGEVKFLDTASPQEVLTFLTTAAPRLQALQVQMELQQTKLTEDVEHARVRLGISKLKYNEFDTSYWDDPKRPGNAAYINPSELRQFLDGILGSAFLYRQYLKGHELRVLPTGSAYNINHETKTIELPVNFEDFSWMSIHQRGKSFERVANSCRRLWWLWFSLALTLVGDLEVF